MAAVSVSDDGVLEAPDPLFAFLKISSLKMERFTIDCNRKCGVILIVDADDGTLQPDAASSDTPNHLVAGLKQPNTQNFK